MKIGLVTAFLPSGNPLNEFGFTLPAGLVNELGPTRPILGEDLVRLNRKLPGFKVERCWAFNKLSNPVRLMRAIRKHKPEIVWFNIGFASFGGSPVPAFIGLAIPALTRMGGAYTHVTLHQLVETVDLNDAGVKSQLLYKIAGSVATHMLLSANSLSVLLPAYRRILRERYRRGSVYVRAHGILSGRPEYPQLAKRGNPVHQILAFGKWGTYKRLELLVAAFEKLGEKIQNVRLVIAGGNHPKMPGYVESVASYCKGDSRIQFTGYVAEEAIPELFQETSITVMPYTSSAGSSGVAHLACEYGVPIVASNIADFQEVAKEEGIAMDFFESGSVESLAQRLEYLLENPERLKAMAEQNFSAALRMSMPEIIRQYVRNFDLHHRVKVLRAASRFRRIPRWMPLRPALSRSIGQKFLTWHDAEFAAYVDPSAAAAIASPANGNGAAELDHHDLVDDTLPPPERVVNIERGSKLSSRKGGDAA